MKKNRLAEKIDEYIDNYGSYVDNVKEKIDELSQAQNSSAVILSEPISVQQKAQIINALYRKGIISQFFERRNGSDNENFENILTGIRKVINEVISSQPEAATGNSKYYRTIWLSDAARREADYGVSTYKTRNLMLKAIFGISQFWYELFTKGAHGKYVADYYKRNDPEQSYYYLPHSDRRFCLTTSDFLQSESNGGIAKFLERREAHWRHLYTSEIGIPDNKLERILAYAYLNWNNSSSPIYLKRDKDGTFFGIKLVINLSLDESYFRNQNLKEVYHLTSSLSYPLKIQLFLTPSNPWCKCEDNSAGKKEFMTDKAEIDEFLDNNEGFQFLADLKKALHDNKALLVTELKNNCFTNDYDKDIAIERFLFNTIDKIIEQDVEEKIESETHRPSIIARLKVCQRNIIRNLSFLKGTELKLEEDILLHDRIRRQMSLWIGKASQRQNEDDLRKKRRDISDNQDFESI